MSKKKFSNLTKVKKQFNLHPQLIKKKVNFLSIGPTAEEGSEPAPPRLEVNALPISY